ncbi:hypothetical protein C8F01DRAFT_1143664 [Mycena amicta]|nr:hypothetical protein C8F01DRAFT_1143664 [Mycena amicta]
MPSSRQIAQRFPSQCIAALQIKTKSTPQAASPALQVGQAFASSSARDDLHPQDIRYRQVFASCSALHQLNDPNTTVQVHDGRRGIVADRWQIVECRALSRSEVRPVFPNSRIVHHNSKCSNFVNSEPPTVHSMMMYVKMLAVTLLLHRASHGCRVKVFAPLNSTAVPAAIPTKSSVQREHANERATIESLDMPELQCDDRMQRSTHKSVDQWSISGLCHTGTDSRCICNATASITH